ncbi:C-C motif chemokine 20-like [Colossoma macropomum]|uniref:C-C motif chemokine 20-like n=1 Tax=Colossoma macropomum TaxID=42526 RepID=UPI001863E496|nr:C-C motif chemokine 20-like [Colossoma macropomum]
MSTKRPPVCFNILSQTLFVFLLLFKEEAAYSDVPLGDQAVECCLSVNDLSIPHQVLVGYHKQLKEQGCSIDAVLFQTKKNKVLCAPPDAPWVKERMNWLDKELKKCQKNGFKGKRCQAMKPTSA